MKVLKAARGYMDVFIGEGWYNHARYQKKKTSNGYKMVHVSGITLKRFQLEQLERHA